MPNWCYNSLEVSGEDAEKFKKDVWTPESELSFNNLIPVPEYEEWDKKTLEKILTKNQLKKCYFSNNSVDWYSFCTDNWGTKWDANEVVTNHSDDSLLYSFETAWSPPKEWLITISQRYNVTFDMISEEEGCDFWCQLTIQNGIIIKDTEMSIKEKIMRDFEGDPHFEEVFKKFIIKANEMKLVLNEDTGVEEIDELREIIDEIDCEFGMHQVYNIFDEILQRFVKKN